MIYDFFQILLHIFRTFTSLFHFKINFRLVFIWRMWRKNDSNVWIESHDSLLFRLSVCLSLSCRKVSTIGKILKFILIVFNACEIPGRLKHLRIHVKTLYKMGRKMILKNNLVCLNVFEIMKSSRHHFYQFSGIKFRAGKLFRF